MENFPLVSVVIPNYNRDTLIKKAVESINSQTYKNIEIIIIDDCSTDNSAETIKYLSEIYTNIRFKFLSENMGANFCRKEGVSIANGDFISFLDSDDTFLPTKLEKQMNILLDNPEIGFVTTGFGESNIKGVKSGNIHLKDLIKMNNIGGFSVILARKKIILETSALDDSLKSCQDWNFYLKMLEKSDGYRLRENLLYYSEQPDSISKNLDNVLQGYGIIKERTQLLNSKYNFYNQSELSSYQEYYLAMRYYKFRDIKNIRIHLLNSLKIEFSMTTFIYYIVSLFGYSSLRFFKEFKILVTRIIRKIR